MGIKKTNFILFGQGRSGSTLLKNLLNSHPAITCEGELFNVADGYATNPLFVKLVTRFPRQFINYRRLRSKNPTYGFTMLYYQHEIKKYLFQNLVKEGWKFIHLKRRDYLSQSLSHLVAKQTATWHRRINQAEKPIRVSIDPKEFVFWTELLKRNKIRENKLFEKLDHLEIVYDDDLQSEDNWPYTSRRIFDFLNVAPASVSSPLLKTYSRPYSEIVENYDELIKLFKDQEIL